MGKKSSIVFSVVGIVLVVVAIVWWTVIGPMLTKLPNDVDTRMDFEGNLTLYVDPVTKQPLAAGDGLLGVHFERAHIGHEAPGGATTEHEFVQAIGGRAVEGCIQYLESTLSG